jgi:hypothetical protein
MFMGGRERVAFWWESCGLLWKVAGMIYAIFGGLTLFRDNFMSPERQKKYATMTLLPQIGWKWWVGAFLVIVVGAILEGTFRTYEKHNPAPSTAPETQTQTPQTTGAEIEKRGDLQLRLLLHVLGRMFGWPDTVAERPKSNVPLPLTAEAAMRRPNLVIYGHTYPDLECGSDSVWRPWRSGHRSKGLVLNIRNDPREDGTGTDAIGVRTQVLFTHSNGYPGPSFSALPRIGERYGIVGIPTGTEKQVLVGIKMGPGGQGHGWMGYATSRLGT